ncbi:hypothetical protein PoB_000747400 [Plakobranchus ocellatus]|uniref:Uncharacterized protein n=1 Tax=Plakobranchus ocellatus TaxID=259542 RepID=A0AAV3YD75_9GAST|nr:hypothetical protein PoB_000747400 [Plakobranchus ocellatus]
MLREQTSSMKCSQTWAKTSTCEAKEPMDAIPRVGPGERMCPTVSAAGCKRQPRQIVAYELPLIGTRRHLFFSTWLCLLSPFPFLRYCPVCFSICCPLLLSLPMWSLG